MTNTPGAIAPRRLDMEALKDLQGEVLSLKTDAVLERLAVLFVVNCFRNTVLENYHAEWPQFTDAKMKPLMQEAVNKLQTAMHAIFNGDAATRDAAWEVLHTYYPTAWDTPEFDQSMLRVIELTKRARKQDAQRLKTANRAPASEATHSVQETNDAHA